MDAKSFREELRQRLIAAGDRTLLRIVTGPGFTPPVELNGQQIIEQAEALADRYAAVNPNDVVLLLLPHSLELFLLHIGLVLRGRIPAILAWPTTRIDPEKYQRNLVHQLRNLPAHQLITLPQLARNLSERLPFPVTACEIANAAHFEKNIAVPVSFAGMEAPPARVADVVLPAEALFLQFSGGTTGAQKAVVVTAPMHVAHLDRLRDELNFTANDGVASWLPMYHDMGLIACLWFPLWNGAASLQFSATDWLLNPEMLFYYMDRFRATFCWLPNFAFSYLANRRPDMQGPHSLAHVRGVINCSEPVRLRSVRAFADAFAAWGIAESALQACYAMAENVFAVTQTRLGDPPVTCARNAVKRVNASYSQPAFDLLDDVYVSSGHTLAGMDVRIAENGRVCSDTEAGEIQIRTPSLFCGYWTADGFVTTSLSDDGWYATGDYGFMAGGELFVIGRMKDIIITGGQNIFPEDVEAIVNTVAAIYRGRVVAFGVPDEQYGTEVLAIAAELQGEYDANAAHTVEREIHRLVLSTIGIAPRHVAVVPERWIVKSTAGKISRRDTRTRFVQERLQRTAAPAVHESGAAGTEIRNA